jgi:hypothetical protein
MALLKNNRIGKYALYALGEIILVIAGILIALQINNKNELRKNEVKINAVLADVQRDLIADFEDLNAIIQVYEEKDSLINRVLSDSIEREDYLRNPALFMLLTTYMGFESKDNAYKNLMRNSDIIPTGYTDFIPLLDDLYLENNKNIQEIQNRLNNLVNNNITNWSEQYTWFLDLIRGQRSEEALDYLLNDPLYKNALATYKIYASDNLLRLYKAHQAQAVLAFYEIQALIKPTESVPAVVSNYMIVLHEEEKNKLLGQYKVLPTFGVRVFLEGSQLMAQATGQSAFALYARSDSVLFNPVVDIELSFGTNATGEFGFTLTQMGRETFFVKE